MAEFKVQTASCARCGKLFSYIGFGFRYCEKCKTYDENEFSLVREYVYEHVDATMAEVEEHTGVSNRRITQYLREGRLEISENSSMFIKCEYCKKDIKSGRYCRACAGKISKDFSGVMYQEVEIGDEPKKGGKMRFLDKNK